MSKAVNARFANGVFTPLEPVAFPEGAIVVLNIEAESAEPPVSRTTATSCPAWKTPRRSSNSST